MLRRLAMIVLGIAAIQGVTAQQGPNPLSDEKVREALQIALKSIQGARCEGSRPCAPATPDEFRTPPISLDQARAAIRAGLASGGMEWCKLDWQRRSFKPLMEHYRRVVGFDERRMALMALLHGMHQGIVTRTMGTQECTPEMRAKLQAPRS